MEKKGKIIASATRTTQNQKSKESRVNNLVKIDIKDLHL